MERCSRRIMDGKPGYQIFVDFFPISSICICISGGNLGVCFFLHDITHAYTLIPLHFQEIAWRLCSFFELSGSIWGFWTRTRMGGASGHFASASFGLRKLEFAGNNTVLAGLSGWTCHERHECKLDKPEIPIILHSRKHFLDW